MKRSLQAVRGHFRHYPVKKSDPVLEAKNAQLWDETFGDDLEAALLDELSKGTGFELHGGLV